MSMRSHCAGRQNRRRFAASGSEMHFLGTRDDLCAAIAHSFLDGALVRLQMKGFDDSRRRSQTHGGVHSQSSLNIRSGKLGVAVAADKEADNIPGIRRGAATAEKMHMVVT
jgi:hypothetical protein